MYFVLPKMVCILLKIKPYALYSLEIILYFNWWYFISFWIWLGIWNSKCFCCLWRFIAWPLTKNTESSPQLGNDYSLSSPFIVQCWISYWQQHRNITQVNRENSNTFYSICTSSTRYGTCQVFVLCVLAASNPYFFFAGRVCWQCSWCETQFSSEADWHSG